jgi:hypothetical protein
VEGRLCENENFKKKVFGAPQFYGAGLCEMKNKKIARKAGKTQRPPEVIPSVHNFFAPACGRQDSAPFREEKIKK